MTTLSAIIFLVSAEYEWATTYIINRVTNGDYGVAIAYCSVLIVLMLAVIWLIQRLVGQRTLGRRSVGTETGVAQLGATAACDGGKRPTRTADTWETCAEAAA